MMLELGFLMRLMLGQPGSYKSSNIMFSIKRFFEVEKNDTNFSVVHLQIREVLFEGFPWIDVTWVISSAFPFLSGLAK